MTRAAKRTSVRPEEAAVQAGEGAAGEASPDWRLEAELWARGLAPVAAVDEAGRGALAGPVVAAAVLLPFASYPYRDSKALPAPHREELAVRVRGEALAWGVGVAQPAEIDSLNVLGATHLAASRALVQLRQMVVPAALVTDYLWLDEPEAVLPVPRADARSYQAAAAGILAKVTRDAMMCELGTCHPGYEFERNKGYGAPAHLAALASLGPCPAHRLTFRPLTRISASLA